MRRRGLPLALALVFGLLVSAAQAGQTWQGVQIMPKSPDVSLAADDGSATSMYDICWPATVVKTKGRLLWVQDDGGYSRNQAGGWIYADDAVKLDDARGVYTGELRKGETAWLYWMRGISWESKGEPGVALVDYKNALRVDPTTTIDDIPIRLGRIFAQEQLLGGRGEFKTELRTTWEGYFKTAKRINPNRPQLYYEWGLALSQACNCTINQQERSLRAKLAAESKPATDAKNNPAQANGGTAPNGAKAAPKFASRGIESDDEPAVDSRQPATQPKPATPSLPSNSVANDKKPVSTAAVDPSAPELVSTITRPGPDATGAEAAVQSLDDYLTAEELSPNWWRIPLARAELMLDQCDEEAATGERVAISPVDTKFFTQLLHHHHKAAGELSTGGANPSPQSVAMRGEEEVSSDGSVKTPPSPPSVLAPASLQVLNTAVDDFNRAISLNPNALDAYRDRAEVLRLVNRPGEAQESATTACNLCYYRQARSLRTLAQISKSNRHYQLAADYALRAAELTSAEEQQRFLQLWYAYSKLASGDTAKIAVASAQAGYVASRGGDDDGGDNAKPSPPPTHIDPPPGFLSRSGSGQ